VSRAANGGKRSVLHLLTLLSGAGALAVVLVVVSARPVVAQEAPASDRAAAREARVDVVGEDRIGGRAGRVVLRGGLLFTRHHTLARVDSEALGPGTLIDVERELGLTQTTTDLRLDGALSLGRRHQVQAGYLSLSRGGRTVLQRTIQFGGSVFEVDVNVESLVDLTIVPVAYRFAFVRTDRLDLGASAGVFALFADAGVSAPAASVAEQESADFPLPVVGADGVVALLPGLFLTGGAKYFRLRISGVQGTWREFRVAGEFFPVANLGIGAGYRSVSLEADGTRDTEGSQALIERPEGSLLFLDYDFKGPNVYVTVRF
jgi:hypothetical protein